MMESHLFDIIFKAPDFASPNILFVFGAFLTLGVLGAIVAHAAKWIPTITIYMLVGLAIGPGGIGLIDEKILSESGILIDIALALILFKLGSEVQLRHLLKSTSLWRVSLIEAILTFGAVFFCLLLLQFAPLPSALIAAIAISSSPAILVHMAEETQARGPVIYRAKALLTLNNVLSFIAFSLLLPFALGQETFTWLDMFLIPAYRGCGAIAIGFIVALLMNYIDRLLDKEEEHFRFALIIGGITIMLGLTAMLQISSLFAALTLGIATRWLEHERKGLSTIEFGSSSDIFFMVLFIMAGANFHLKDLFTAGKIALALSLVRAFAKTLTFLLNKETPDEKPRSAFALGLKLMPMGALAIGLAQTLKNFSPTLSQEVMPIVFATVALLETFGPFAVSAAFRITGESQTYRNKAALVAQEEEKKQQTNGEEEEHEEKLADSEHSILTHVIPHVKIDPPAEEETSEEAEKPEASSEDLK